MQTYLECIPCFVRQAIDAAQLAGGSDDVQEQVVRRVLEEVSRFPFDSPPPLMAERIHAIARELCGGVDPYREAKRASNELALELVDELRPRVAGDRAPFHAAARLAAAANVIDLGAMSTRDMSHEAIRRELLAALEENGGTHDLDALSKAVEGADTVLYFTDNAGEIAFDRLFIEQMPPGVVTAVVRGGAVLNDATYEDAEAVGLTEVARVLDTGRAAPGVVLDTCPDAVRRLFAEADVVIAKGQGNYESLSGKSRPGLFFLLRVKCPVVARDSGFPVGRLVFHPGRGGAAAP